MTRTLAPQPAVGNQDAALLYDPAIELLALGGPGSVGAASVFKTTYTGDATNTRLVTLGYTGVPFFVLDAQTGPLTSYQVTGTYYADTNQLGWADNPPIDALSSFSTPGAVDVGESTGLSNLTVGDFNQSGQGYALLVVVFG